MPPRKTSAKPKPGAQAKKARQPKPARQAPTTNEQKDTEEASRQERQTPADVPEALPIEPMEADIDETTIDLEKTHTNPVVQILTALNDNQDEDQEYSLPRSASTLAHPTEVMPESPTETTSSEATLREAEPRQERLSASWKTTFVPENATEPVQPRNSIDLHVLKKGFDTRREYEHPTALPVHPSGHAKTEPQVIAVSGVSAACKEALCTAKIVQIILEHVELKDVRTAARVCSIWDAAAVHLLWRDVKTQGLRRILLTLPTYHERGGKPTLKTPADWTRFRTIIAPCIRTLRLDSRSLYEDVLLPALLDDMGKLTLPALQELEMTFHGYDRHQHALAMRFAVTNLAACTFTMHFSSELGHKSASDFLKSFDDQASRRMPYLGRYKCEPVWEDTPKSTC